MNTVKNTRYANYCLSYEFAWKVVKDIDLMKMDVYSILEESFGDLAKKDDIIVTEIELNKDYVRVLASAMPKMAPSEIVNKLKGISGRRIGLKTGINKVWDRGYTCFTKENMTDKIINFI